ncbi:MAG: hypothetical protein ACSHYA_01035 [Opitutaceae bacterium]
MSDKNGLYPESHGNIKWLEMLFRGKIARIALSVRSYDQFLFSCFLMQRAYTSESEDQLLLRYRHASETIGRGWLSIVDQIKSVFRKTELTVWVHEETPLLERFESFVPTVTPNKLCLESEAHINVSPSRGALAEIDRLTQSGAKLTHLERDQIVLDHAEDTKVDIDELLDPKIQRTLCELYASHLEELRKRAFI